jgi:hypothetical protein
VGEPADAGPDSRLRDHLHGDCADFVELYEGKALAEGDIELAQAVRAAHQFRLDAMLEGREVKHIARADLPDWHQESCANTGGSPYDRFTLGPDDVLRPEESTAPPGPMPNRAQRRAAGWRGPWLNGDGRA